MCIRVSPSPSRFLISSSDAAFAGLGATPDHATAQNAATNIQRDQRAERRACVIRLIACMRGSAFLAGENILVRHARATISRFRPSTITTPSCSSCTGGMVEHSLNIGQPQAAETRWAVFELGSRVHDFGRDVRIQPCDGGLWQRRRAAFEPVFTVHHALAVSHPPLTNR